MEIPSYLLKNFTNLDYSNIKQGGEAIVFRGTLLSVQGDVAIKKWSHTLRDEAEKRRVRREVALLMQTPHVNIIKFLGILIDGQSEWIGYVMPYMEKGSLYERESYDDVKLSDFGIARSLTNPTDSLTTGRGTEFYIAPEIFKGEVYTLSADIYSLSITIWEILHRKIPYYHMKYPSLFVLYQMISTGVRPQLGNDLSKEVSSLLTRCWHVDAFKRSKINEILRFYRKTTFLLPKISPKKLDENFDAPPPIEQNPGGYDRENWDSLLMLENDKDDWKQINIKLPYAIMDHGAQFLNNNLYIFGGQNASLKSINCTFKLSNNSQWMKMADMNQKREKISNSSVILNNQIWVCGGWDEHLHPLKSVEMYDPQTNKWKFMKEMKESRHDAAAAVVNGKIFCCGGYELNSVECYDPLSNIWTLVCNMPQKIFAHGAVEIDGHFIVMGGWNGRSRNYLKNVWALDTMDNNVVWIEKPSMSAPRNYFSIAKIGLKIFICGGYSGRGISDVEIFDGELWKNGPRMPTSRYHAPAVVIPIEFARYLN